MADIAMLVAEEYERRVKNSRTQLGAEKQEIDLLSCVAVLAQNVKARVGGGHQTFQAVKLAVEPKTPIAAAAFTGAFSA